MIAVTRSSRDLSSADAVIVGSGAGGAAVAGELAREGARVVIVEAGDGTTGGHARNTDAGPLDAGGFGSAILDGLGPHGYDAEPDPSLGTAWVSHAVGGGLRYWTHHCPEPHKSEWPAAISGDARERLLDHALARLEVTSDLRGGVRQARIIEGLAGLPLRTDRDRPVSGLPVAGKVVGGHVRYSGADTLLAHGAGTGNVTIVTGHAARNIERRAGSVSAVEVAPLAGGAARRIAAPIVVVAAGAMGSPQLLFESGTRPPALGRYLTDHPMVSTRIRLRADLMAGVERGDTEFAVWIPFGDHRRRHVQIVRAPIADGVPSVDPRPDWADVVGFSTIEPRPENRLVFSESQRDGLGLPRLKAEFAFGSADRDALAACVRESVDLSVALARPESGWTTRLGGFGTSLHLMGTTRLGTDDQTSVADEYGRVWGTHGLYVAGNSVLSSAGASNPTLMTVAIALHSARSIVAGA